MKLIFDTRVLTHKHYTGVENYTKNILDKLSLNIKIYKAIPIFKNKYLLHLWNHFILPFKSGNILFCPANIAPIFLPHSKKLVVTIHDVAFLAYPESFSSFFQLYYKWLIPIVVKRADKIITVSHSSKEEILKYYPVNQEKIEVVSLGIDKRYRVLENMQKQKTILYVGSLNERKNFNSIIKAFELLNREDYMLTIVGNFSSNFPMNENTKKVLNDAKLNKNIEFKSNISDNELVNIYNQSTVLVFPSFYEGFGLPPLEAMACGTPVITSNISSMPEVCGDAALYCNPYSVEDIKEKIALLLNDNTLQKKMIEKGLARVENFTWEKSALEHIEVFQKVLKF